MTRARRGGPRARGRRRGRCFFNARDLVECTLYALLGARALASSEAGRVAESAGAQPNPPRLLDASLAQTDNRTPSYLSHFQGGPEPGEGTVATRGHPLVEASDDCGAKATGAPVGRGIPSPPPYFYTTTIRPDAPSAPTRRCSWSPWICTSSSSRSTRRRRSPETPYRRPWLRGKAPHNPKILRPGRGHLNGAFKTTHRESGMMVHGRVLLPPKPNAATGLNRGPKIAG